MTDVDSRAAEVLEEFSAQIRFAAAKRYRRLGGMISYSDLIAGAQECLCGLAGLTAAPPSQYDKLDGWRKECEGDTRRLHRFMQHALDWALSNWSRRKVTSEGRKPGHPSLDVVPENQGDYADWDRERGQVDYPTSPYSNPEDDYIVAEMWERFPLLAARYRDGETTHMIGARLGITASSASKRLRKELAEARNEMLASL